MSDLHEDSQDRPALWRLTTADKRVFLPSFLLGVAISPLGAAGLINALDPDTDNIASDLGVSGGIGLALFIALNVALIFGALKIFGRAAGVLDEVERAIERKANSWTLISVVYAAFAYWCFGEWFQAYRPLVQETWFFFVFVAFLVSYFLARARIRARLSA